MVVSVRLGFSDQEMLRVFSTGRSKDRHQQNFHIGPPADRLQLVQDID